MQRSFYKKHAKKIVLAAMILLWIMVVIAMVNDFTLKKETFLQAEQDSFSSKLNAALRTYEKFSNHIFESTIDQPEIINLMKQADTADQETQHQIRNEMHALLHQQYQQLQQYHFRQMHLHNAQGDSFLRMHIPEKYGDNLLEVRDSIRLVNQQHTYVFGFEEGRIFNGYRFVYPLFAEEEFIGSAEVSISMASVIEILQELYPTMETSFTIDAAVVRDVVWEDQQYHYIENPCLPGYLLDVEAEQRDGEDVVSRDVLNRVTTAAVSGKRVEAFNDRKSFSTLVTDGSTPYLVHFMAINNITGNPVAYLTGISEYKGNLEMLKTINVETYLITLLFIALFVVIWIRLSKQEIMEKHSSTDSLTGMYNRHRFLQGVKMSLKTSKQAAIILLDIDHFKVVNDTHGHPVGDQVLIAVANVLLESVRGEDMACRWGGEEFIVFLPNATAELGGQVAERLRQRMDALEIEKVGCITASFGVALCNSFENLDQAIHAADQALYKAKESGRNCVVTEEADS